MFALKLESVKSRARENRVTILMANELIQLPEKIHRWMMASKTR
jgi:hypothetical protein